MPVPDLKAIDSKLLEILQSVPKWTTLPSSSLTKNLHCEQKLSSCVICSSFRMSLVLNQEDVQKKKQIQVVWIF